MNYNVDQECDTIFGICTIEDKYELSELNDDMFKELINKTILWENVNQIYQNHINVSLII